MPFVETSAAAGGGSQPSMAFWGINQTGPNSGLDDNLPLVPFGNNTSGGTANAIVGNSGFSIPVTIGAGGGFGAYMEVDKAFALANPDLSVYFELAVANADGTEKLAYGLNVNTSFDTSGGVAVPVFPVFSLDDYFIVEQVGSDLSGATVNTLNMGIESAAGGQLFANLYTQVQGFAA